ncbi:MAG: hypothetical protein JXR96_02920 [Deltaproteobacteria bacterium]|nr:hypothetical protein [Deltaproteobacteria bacterium]
MSLGAFDCKRVRSIQFGAPICALALLCAGCPAREAAQDAGLTDAPRPDAAAQADEMADGTQLADARAGDSSPADDIQTGIVTRDGERLVQAIGRARRGADVDLARQAAASRARAELLKILKENGFSTDGSLRGSRVTRFWIQGRHVYALASMPLPADPKSPMNESGPAPSNSAGEPGADSASRTGGPRK